MIERGTSHVLRSEHELLKRIKHPSTLRLLDQLQWFYEVKKYSELFDHPENLVNWHQAEWAKAMELLRTWMQAPLTVNFTGYEKTEYARGFPTTSGSKTIITKKERRRQRREERKKRLAAQPR